MSADWRRPALPAKRAVAPKLLLDEHLSPTIAHRLTALGFDVTSVRDRGLLGLDDWDLMEWCGKEGRAICTRNAELDPSFRRTPWQPKRRLM